MFVDICILIYRLIREIIYYFITFDLTPITMASSSSLKRNHVLISGPVQQDGTSCCLFVIMMILKFVGLSVKVTTCTVHIEMHVLILYVYSLI
jgi:hypothetical protein